MNDLLLASMLIHFAIPKIEREVLINITNLNFSKIKV
jgi:hypothetical protein